MSIFQKKMPSPPKTNVYIDGFNFYYGCMKGSSYKWLNILKLCQLMLPNDNIHEIKYFTAKVKALPSDPDQPIRQQIYFRALKTIPNLEIFYGHFLTHEVSMPVVATHPQRWERVYKTEEKGSDVNLATHLLFDAFQNNYDTAVLITNDSDLYEPVKVVKNHFHKPVGIINPHSQHSAKLKSVATFLKRIRRSHLQSCQFPNPLTDPKGTFGKPQGW